MKTTSILSAVLSAAIIIGSATADAQEHRNRRPTPTEASRIAGLSFYPQEANIGTWWSTSPANLQSFKLIPGVTNNLVFHGLTPVIAVCDLPNPTNNMGVCFNLIGCAGVSIQLTNTATSAPGNSISSSTNSLLARPGLLCRTNAQLQIVNPHGTNWVAIITHLGN